MSRPQNAPSQKKRNSRNHRLKKRIIIAAAAAVVLGGIAWAKFSGNSRSLDADALFPVKQGHLRISVLESGKVQAQRSQSLNCEVEGQSTIISIIPEGTYANEGDVLVELDSSDLRERIDEQEITLETANASFKQADEAYQIQQNQNESDIKAAQLALDFARIDLEKYLGREVREDEDPNSIKTIKLALDLPDIDLKKYAGWDWDDLLADAQAAGVHIVPATQNNDASEASEASGTPIMANAGQPTGGDWHQQLWNALYEIVQKDSSLKLTEDQVKGTRELYKRQYVTETALKSDESAYQNAVIAMKQAAEKMRLLIKYDHPKQLAKFMADYEEAGKELGRVKRKAASQLAQKEADRNAKKRTYDMQKDRLAKRKEQLEKTAIKAPQPGLVIYASSTGQSYRRDQRLIEEGETVYERQRIIELPDLSAMKVDIKIHESVRDLIKQGQKAIITVEAVRGADSSAGLTLHGHVEKVAILPDSGDRWMNPDLTVYPTSVIIDEQSDALKPGMSAKVEVIIAELENVLYVPVQAVTVRGDQEVCYVARGSKYQERPVELGLSNDNYIEIKSGLKKGEKVRTYAPVTAQVETRRTKPAEEKPGKEGTETSSSPTERATGEGEGPDQSATGPPQGARPSLRNLTPEQKQEFQRRLKEAGITEEIDFENLTPEQMREIGRKLMQRGGPRGGPRTPGEGSRPEGERSGRRPRRPSTEGPGASDSNAPRNP